MPTRYLKPGVRDSEAIDNLSPQAEILFYRLLVTVDDFGRFDARPAMVKAQCFPIKDSISIAKCKDLLDELNNKGLIYIYEVEGKLTLTISKWDNIPRAKVSKYPPPVYECMQVHANAEQMNTCANNVHADAPLTVTKTETKTKRENKQQDAPEGVSQFVWDEFISHRKSKKANVTDLVIEGISKEASKAGWSLEDALKEIVIRNWQSFKAEWVEKERKTSSGILAGAI